MTDLDLAYTPATELARRIAAGELSPVAVVENSLARIAEVNPTLNCFCFTYRDEALEKAGAAERSVAAGAPLGPLHGVPIAIKDLTPTKGKRTTLGSYTHEHWVPETDAVIVEKLLGAGAILVGKTNTPEFAYSSFTESPLWAIMEEKRGIHFDPEILDIFLDRLDVVLRIEKSARADSQSESSRPT